jgi:hypothetical protein
MEQVKEQMVIEMNSNQIPIATIAHITKLTEQKINEIIG